MTRKFAYLEFKPDVISLTDIQQLDQPFRDPIQLIHVVFTPRPELDSIDLTPQTHYRTADLVILLQLLSNQGHDKPVPTSVQQLRVVLHRQHPLAAIGVGRILPHGLDARFEDVVVAVLLELGGGLEPVEVAAEFFDSVEFANDGEVGFVLLALGVYGGGWRWFGGVRGGGIGTWCWLIEALTWGSGCWCIWEFGLRIVVYRPV